MGNFQRRSQSFLMRVFCTLLMVVNPKIALELTDKGHLRQEEKEVLLGLLNQYRASPQTKSQNWLHPLPKAANMMELRWDDRLELIAQNYTDKCIFQHNMDHDQSPLVKSFWKDMKDDVNDVYLGEIMQFMFYNKHVDSMQKYLSSFVEQAFSYQNQKRPFDFGECNCGRGVDCVSGWSQLVTMLWAESELVGCVQSYCPATTTNYILLCNFYPGPYYDVCPYEKFYDWVQCPKNYFKSPQGLCACSNRCRYQNVAIRDDSESDNSQSMMNDGTSNMKSPMQGESKSSYSSTNFQITHSVFYMAYLLLARALCLDV